MLRFQVFLRFSCCPLSTAILQLDSTGHSCIVVLLCLLHSFISPGKLFRSRAFSPTLLTCCKFFVFLLPGTALYNQVFFPIICRASYPTGSISGAKHFVCMIMLSFSDFVDLATDPLIFMLLPL